MTARHTLSLALVLAFAAPTAGCSMAKLAAGPTVEIVHAGVPAIKSESDPALGEAGLVSTLKLLEAIALTVPDNEQLLQVLAEGFSSYAFAFVEPGLIHLTPLTDEYDALVGRLKDFYGRAAGYALRLLEQADEDIHAAVLGDVSKLASRLAKVDDEETIDALFWVGFTYGLLVNADLEDLSNVIKLPVSSAIMDRVVQVSPDHGNGLAQVLIGTTQSVLGTGMGGDMDRAKAAFEHAIGVHDGNFLVPDFMMARHYCIAVNDQACFNAHMQKVIDADLDDMPAERLTNTLAQQWAEEWMARDDLF